MKHRVSTEGARRLSSRRDSGAVSPVFCDLADDLIEAREEIDALRKILSFVGPMKRFGWVVPEIQVGDQLLESKTMTADAHTLEEAREMVRSARTIEILGDDLRDWQNHRLEHFLAKSPCLIIDLSGPKKTKKGSKS